MESWAAVTACVPWPAAHPSSWAYPRKLALMWEPKQFCSRIFCHPVGLLTFDNTQFWESRGKRNYAKHYIVTL